MISDVFYYFQGNLRWLLARFFGMRALRCHVREQVVGRMLSAHRECVDGGRCRICGCHTPALFYCGRGCDGYCYPGMMGFEKWESFKKMGGDDEWVWDGERFGRRFEVYG